MREIRLYDRSIDDLGEMHRDYPSIDAAIEACKPHIHIEHSEAIQASLILKEILDAGQAYRKSSGGANNSRWMFTFKPWAMKVVPDIPKEGM